LCITVIQATRIAGGAIEVLGYIIDLVGRWILGKNWQTGKKEKRACQ
jgi:hypothetical protein